MEDLKKLLAGQQFEAILKKTASSKDPEELFYRVNAYFGLGKDQEGIQTLLNNEDLLYEYHPIQYMKMLLEARLALGQFDEAYEDNERFQNKPYVSQEVEEVLRNLIAFLRGKERESFRKKERAPSEVKKILKEEEDDFTVLQVLGEIRNDPSYYEEDLRAVVGSDRHPLVKTFALLILVSLKSTKSVVLKKNKKTYSLIPSELVPPYVGEGFARLKSDIASYTKNTSLNDVATSLLEEYIIASYPEPVVYPDEDEVLLPSFFVLASNYLQSKDGETILSSFGEEKQSKTRQMAKFIQNILDQNPPLKY
ncbi:MAG: hypothetical protein J6038_01315 [Bacilli bacterium]|nr:hypothetical protein [Bacilli bacterium]